MRRNWVMRKLFCFLLLIIIISAISWYAIPSRTTLRILLITSSQQLKPGESVWQASRDKAKGYIDLLSAYSIPYDVAWIDKTESLNIFKTSLKHASHSLIILALNRPESSPPLLKLIKQANRKGVNVIADLNSLDENLVNYFNIEFSSESFTSTNVHDALTGKIFNFAPRHFRSFKIPTNQKIQAIPIINLSP